MIIIILFIEMSTVAQITGTYTDSRDGKVYKTVTIGMQTWMAENLAYKAIDGCLAYNNDQNNIIIYGYLYDWNTAMNVCPSGWHLPTETEWSALSTFLGGDDLAGGKLKEADTLHWHHPNTGATNESGFTALPGGLCYSNGISAYIGIFAHWWSATEHDSANAFKRFLDNGSTILDGDWVNKSNIKYSVRCIKD